MARFFLLAAALMLSLLATLATGVTGLGNAHSQPVSYPNFACAGYGNWGVCIGPPTRTE